MARVWVPLQSFQEGDFPSVCVKTGGLADRWVSVRAVWTPRWTWSLLQYTVLPFQVVYWLIREDATGWVPMSARAARRLGWIRYASLAGLATGVLLLGSALAIGRREPIAPGLAALLIAVTAGLSEPLWSIGAHLDRSTHCVLLRRVHPSFVAAIAAAGG
jgi:hypothetical protein